jgi:hypothetical protein
MTKMPAIMKRDGSRELQWLAAWGATRAAKKNQDELNSVPSGEPFHDLALVPVLSAGESDMAAGLPS